MLYRRPSPRWGISQFALLLFFRTGGAADGSGNAWKNANEPTATLRCGAQISLIAGVAGLSRAPVFAFHGAAFCFKVRGYLFKLKSVIPSLWQEQTRSDLGTQGHGFAHADGRAVERVAFTARVVNGEAHVRSINMGFCTFIGSIQWK